ncbi:Hypothetical predicted protein, partial [Paramuricea clavata]
HRIIFISDNESLPKNRGHLQKKNSRGVPTIIHPLKENKLKKDPEGEKLVNGPRKTFVLGFAVSSRSIIALARRLLERNYNKFDYLLTYRFSQDQIEMYFSKISITALRTVLQKNLITAPTTGNCTNVTEKPEKELEPDKRILQLLDSSPVWRDDVHGYIGVPSQSVVKVVQVTDKILREKLHQWHLMQKKTLQEIKKQVLQETKPSTFIELQQHSRECHILDENLRDDHITTLVHGISDLYVKIFIHRFGKIYSEKIVRGGQPSKRQKLNKLILFGND